MEPRRRERLTTEAPCTNTNWLHIDRLIQPCARAAIPTPALSAGDTSIFLGMTWTIPDLNTRETAMLVWIILALAVALAIPSGREIVVDGVKIAARPFVSVMLTVTTLLALAITICLAWLGYWRTPMIPATIAWFVGTAIIGTFSTDGVGDLRRLAARTVALTAAVEFVSNAYTLPLPVAWIPQNARNDGDSGYACRLQLVRYCLRYERVLAVGGLSLPKPLGLDPGGVDPRTASPYSSELGHRVRRAQPAVTLPSESSAAPRG